MDKHILSLRYDGLDAASDHGIGTAGSKQVVAGAQMLLGACAHYYIDAVVPDRVNDRAAGFVIRDIGRRQGSLIMDFAISLAASAVWDVLNSIYGFDRMALEAYRAWKNGRLFEDPPYERRQRSLQASGVNQTVFDSGLADQFQRRRLYQRTGQAVSFITAPLGKSASVVELTMNGHRFDTLRSRVPSGEDIDEWLREYRGVNEAPLRLS